MSDGNTIYEKNESWMFGAHLSSSLIIQVGSNLRRSVNQPHIQSEASYEM